MIIILELLVFSIYNIKNHHCDKEVQTVPNIYLGGVKGCGKTKVCELMQSQHPEIVIVSGSQAMRDAAHVSSVEELNTLSPDVKDRVRRIALADISGRSNVLAEGHFWLVPEDIPCFQAFVHIDVSPDRLVVLRSNDSTRTRSLSLLDIDTENKDLRARVGSLEETYNIEVVRLPNDSTLEVLFRKLSAIYLALSKAPQ